ncbi:unnamed protein product [Sphagnum troendelagicum]
MGSPEKEPVKRRKSEGVQSFKDRDWDDEHGGWEKEYKHRPSKSRRSSKSDQREVGEESRGSEDYGKGARSRDRGERDRDEESRGSEDYGKVPEAKDRLERERGEESSRVDRHPSRERSDWEEVVEDGGKYRGGSGERGDEIPRVQRHRRGRDRLEREESDFVGKFSGKAERERGERDRGERDRGGRDKGEERSRGERDRGERERGDESSRSDHQRKAREKEKWDERHTEGHGERHKGIAKSNDRGRGERDEHNRDKYRARERPESGWGEDSEDVQGRSSGRDRGEQERAAKPSTRDREDDKTQGLSLARDKGDEEKVGRSGSRARLQEEGAPRLGLTREEDRGEEKGKGKERLESGYDVSEDRGRSRTRNRSGKASRPSQSPDEKRVGGRSYQEDYKREWSDERDDYERDRDSNRRGGLKRERDSREKERDRHRGGRERPSDQVWDRERAKDWGESVELGRERQRESRHKQTEVDKGREADYRLEHNSWETEKRHERVEREKSERERIEREGSERSRMESDRVDGTRGFGTLSESSGRNNTMMPKFMESARGSSTHGGPFLPPGGDAGYFPGEYHGGVGEVDWDGPILDDRMRMRDKHFLGGVERYMEEEGPLGHDSGFGPGRGGGGGSDGGMGYTLHAGRGRAPKSSPNTRGRGGIMGYEGRPLFGNNQGGGGGPMLRGMQQQGVKGGRGGRGGVKGGRGSGREGQRGGVVPPIMGPGPSIGPHFGPLGPPVPMAGMVPGPGLGPGMGPGGFPMPHFGGPMGWGGGHGGDMGMMGCPPGPGPGLGPGGPGGLGPRFGPGMGPGPGPNMFFNPPAPGRGLGGMPGGMFGGGGVPPFGGGVGIAGVGRGMMGERGPPGGGRGMMGRGSGPPGRGPSRGEQNDYSQHFVDTGLRPQNFIRDVELADRFEEYPKLKELITRKDRLIADRATPPMYMQCDLRTTELQPETFGTKFDVILVDPPWEEYVRRAPGIGDSMEWWSPEDIQNLRIEAIADTPAFIFLWVGDAEGLEQGRHCLKKWGFRRCEDICWVKTNRENPTPALRHDSNTLFQHSKEHCLMGIKGTVRRSSDGHIIHANVDTDIIISEEPEYGSTTKPEELYHIIEHFAQGQRRIELFGEDHNIRAGWVTVGKGLTSSNFNPQIYGKYFTDAEGKVWQGGRGNPPIDAPHLVGTTPEIEALRPKSPPPRPQQPQPSGQGNAGNSLSQPSAGNSNNKKTSTGPVTGGQNGHPTPLVPGAGHGSLNPLGAGPNVIGQPPLVGGRGGGHGQIPKLRQILPVAIPKHLGAGPGIEEFGLDEEASFGGEVQETSTEVEVLTITEPENHPQIDWG